MHFSDSSKSNDTTESSKASTSMSRFMSYWQYYHRKNSPFLESFIHLWSQGFHLSSIIKSSLSSSHHHHILITSSSHHHPQSVKITSNIKSAGNYYISWKDSQSRKEKKKGVRLWIKVDLRYTSLLHNHKIAWVSWPLCTLSARGGLCTLSAVYTMYTLCTFILVIWVWKCKDHWTTKDCRLGQLTTIFMTHFVTTAK